MRSARLVLALPSLFSTAVVGYANESTPIDKTHFFRKRWYSVPEHPGQGEAQDPFVYPWPVVCQHPYVQPIYYCFQDKRSAKNLQHVVNEAITKWAHAIRVSSLSTELDPRTLGDTNVPCSQLEGDKDSLVISDETLDDPDVEKVKKHFNSGLCQTQTTVGYTYEPKVPFRHTLKFCDLQPWDAEADMPHAVRVMTHELGHAIGLQHEHQRPDRNDHIYVYYRNLEGYDELPKICEEDTNNYFKVEEGGAEIPIAERVKAVISDDIYMRAYFPSALDWLPSSRFATPTCQEKWSPYTFSTNFDFESIMLYDATSGLSDTARAAGKYSITRKDKTPIWMGGSRSADGYSVSEGDIARVAMLYDKHDEECEKAKKGEYWKGVEAPKALRVRIRDGFEGVVHPPRGVRERDEI